METNRSHCQRQKGGIQLLLAAEQESKQIVNAAKNAKLARLKQAKEELETEVAEYRAQMELEYQQKVTESSNRDSGTKAKRLEQETGEKIDRLKMEAGKILQDVNLILLKDVITVKV